MDIFTLGFGFLVLSSYPCDKKDKEQSQAGDEKSRGMMQNMLGDIVAIIFMIGAILSFIPPETIERVLGRGMYGFHLL